MPPLPRSAWPILIALPLLALPLLLAAPVETKSSPASCSYESYRWNVKLRKAVRFERVSHPYSQLTPEEIDTDTGCTLCSEDQVEIRIGNIPSFRVCRKIAPELQQALEYLVAEGEPIRTVVGYRTGRTRGDVDTDGNRTGFSNHAYGAAIDINPEQNGLYAECMKFGPGCRLIKGGRWRPGEHPASLLPDGKTVRTMQAIGFRWGGEIEGRQKDFMHFSVSGY